MLISIRMNDRIKMSYLQPLGPLELLTASLSGLIETA